MTPMVIVRGLGGLALPFGLGLTVLDRRRKASGRRDGEPATDGDPRPRARRRALRSIDDAQQLRGFDLRGADLRRVPLAGADLNGLDLHHAHLRRADLSGTDLSFATLDYADLSGADLRGAALHGTTLLEADLAHADLRGADLRAARQLPMANLRGAVSDRTTRWPSGFVPER